VVGAITPEQSARVEIDRKLEAAGWVVQDFRQMDLSASRGVAVREFPTATGPVDVFRRQPGLFAHWRFGVRPDGWTMGAR
jgi:hypothetical protein